MRRLGDGRAYAVISWGSREIEVHPDLFNACEFLLTDPAISAKIEVGVLTGNISTVHINGLPARALTPAPAKNDPLYAFMK
jgi:hypothetical protein